MKIQEMKSGFLHLTRKVEEQRRNNLFEMRPAAEALIDVDLPIVTECELENRSWSVVSFDKLEAGGLTYDQAAILISQLHTHGISGLCIVTDAAAARMDAKPKMKKVIS